MKKVGIGICIGVVLLLVVIGVTTSIPTPEKLQVENIESYQVQSGDTLESVAKSIDPDNFKKVMAWIEETNSLGLTGSLHQGNYIIIPVIKNQPSTES